MRSRLVAVGLVMTIAVVAGAVSIFSGAASQLYWKAYAAVFSVHPTLRVAVPPLNDHGQRLLTALQLEIASDRTRLQLAVVETASLLASAQALREQNAELAVVRSDDPAAAGGRAIFVLKTIQLALLVPAQGAIDGVAKLKGKQIGVLANDSAIDPMIKRVLDFHGFEDKQIVRLRSGELAGALQRKQVAALAVVGPAGAGPIADAIAAFRTATKRPPKFLDLSQAQTIAERFAVYEEAEISAGAFGGAPALPSEKVDTLGTKVVLIARPSLSNHAAGELTRLLLATKSKLAASWPEARQLAAPATDKGALLPAHPGTVAFLDAEQSDLLDKSTNVLLLGSLLTGLVGWLATRVATLRGRRKGQELKVCMQRLPVLLAQANGAAAEEFGAIEAELAQLSQWLLRKFMEDEISPTDFHSAEARLAHIGALIQKKRRSASLASIEQFYQQWRSSAATVAAC